MKIVVFGANGKTGSLFVEQALSSGHKVIAFVRRLDSIAIENPNLKIVVGTLNEKDKLRGVIVGSDAVVSTLGGGSLTKHNPEVVEGIETIVNLMEETLVPRLLYMSSIGAGESRFYMPQPIRFLIVNVMLRIPLADHNSNEKRIAASNLKWTVVRPGGLTDGPKTGNLKHGSDKTRLAGNSGISRANVAAFMLHEIVENAYVKKCVWLHE